MERVHPRGLVGVFDVPRALLVALDVPRALLGTLVLAALLAPWLAPFDPGAQLDIIGLKNSAPSLSHWLGTDPFSRDLFSRALYGARTSLTVAALATCVALLLGTAWGTLAATLPPRGGALLMSVVDILRSVPRVLFFLGAVVALGPLSAPMLALVLGASAWTGISRLVYVRVREVQGQPFVEAARALGMASPPLLWRHVAPHLASPLAASGILLLADILAVEAGLSFIGLGVRPPTASWGSMLQDALPYVGSAWWLTAVPAALLITTVLSAASVADALSDGPTRKRSRRFKRSRPRRESDAALRGMAASR